MNLLNGTFETRDGASIFRISEDAWLPVPPGIQQPHGASGIYGVRPEHLGAAAPGQGIAAKVIVVEPLGPEIQVMMSVGDQTLVAVFRDRVNVEPDQVLSLTPQMDRVCLFDAHGKRLVAST
jgi:multiple sugar transport system ATP-binding protein